jgi:hypothetical protein
MKLKITKQTLNDWSVEGSGLTFAWIRRGKDKIFTVEYTKYLTTRIELPEYAGSFKEAKTLAVKTITHFTE